ncbi:MAG: hypothetical protein H7323_00860 [Frankiales bacterium]|nr:hypothetical protein [Frankiales bacterium]
MTALALPVSARPTVADLLHAQDAVITRRQARGAGMSEDQWQWRLDTGRWQSVLYGVAIAHSGVLTDRQRSWAAVLFAGAGCYLSADAALIEHGMTLAAPVVLHVATPATRHMTPQAFVDDRVRRVRPHRMAVLDEWIHPLRTPRLLRVAPAVLHAAAWAPTDRAGEWRIAAAVQQRLVRPGEVRAALGQMPSLRRHGLIATVLDDVELGAHAASELAFLRLLRRHQLPAPDRLQRLVRAGTVCYLDAWWERQRVAAELDGAHHRSVGVWDADALRGNDVVISERHDRVLLLRLTTGNLRHDEARVAEQLRTALL